MKTGQELYNEHLNRLKDTFDMKKTDRPPIVSNADAFYVQYAGGKISDLVTDVVRGNEEVIEGMQKMGDIDSIELAGCYPPSMGLFFLADIKVPGRDLPDNMIWQIDEKNPMTEEDYDTIIDKGWNYYFGEVTKKHLAGGVKEMEYFGQIAPGITQKFIDAGIVPLCGGAMAGAPFGSLSSARGISAFIKDMYKMPDKVLKAMEVMAEESEAGLKQAIRAFKPLTVFTGGAREAGDFLSYKAFEKFAWHYTKRIVDIIAEEGSIAYLHLDMCWDRFLKYFLDLPKGKCIFSPDSTTDIFKAKEVLYGHMCFMGDVSPSLLTLGTPDEVYAYARKLIDEFADKGLIMSSGCSIPANAKPENVKAMLSAAWGK
ncbi:MAG: uroporphyrinogen decarboxylase family protein [Clostridiales bacterium]|nr:uroporphyrinogen-III decarboxylase [Eubacteriales bacterium]MDH7567114.1 uroporphyrinogen decarboxylase family protein [Clostridiales bacterium]